MPCITMWLQGKPPAQTKVESTDKNKKEESVIKTPETDKKEENLTTKSENQDSSTMADKQGASTAKPTASKSGDSKESEDLIPDDPIDQRKFDDAISTACLLIKPESLSKCITKNISKLELQRALPTNFDMYSILSKLSNLQVCLWFALL